MVSFHEVVRLAEQLSPQEQQALIAHLQSLSQQRPLSVEELSALRDAVTVNVPPGVNFSDRREDWYDDYAEWEKALDALKDNRPVLNDFSNRREDWYDDDGR